MTEWKLSENSASWMTTLNCVFKERRTETFVTILWFLSFTWKSKKKNKPTKSSLRLSISTTWWPNYHFWVCFSFKINARSNRLWHQRFGWVSKTFHQHQNQTKSATELHSAMAAADVSLSRHVNFSYSRFTGWQFVRIWVKLENSHHWVSRKAVTLEGI